MKKLMIASHERSGTHFLINSIVNNSYGIFGQPDIYNPSLDVCHSGPYDDPEQYKQNVKDFLLGYSGRFESKVFKTHHKAEFFEDYIDELKDEFCILYIKRNPLDVLTSLYFYYRTSEKRRFPHPNWTPDLEAFLYNLEPTDEWYSLTKNASNAKRLKEHIEGWEDLGVNMVNYEDLNKKFSTTMDEVYRLVDGLHPRGYYSRPPLSGVLPRKGKVNDHVNLLSRDQIKDLEEFFGVR